MQTAAIGRIVHYKFREDEGGMERPAIIVHVWGGEYGGAVQLQVFIDADENGLYNDGRRLKSVSNVVWRTSVTQGKGPGQFHFHEDCPLVEPSR